MGRVRRTIWLVIIVSTVFTAAIIIMAAPISPPRDTVSLEVGDVTTADVIAPRFVSYESQIETEAAREAAANAIPDVYDPPDSRVARQQVASARKLFDYISSVRADAFATPEQKYADLAAADFTIDAAMAKALLDLNDTGWSAVQAETISVIERVLSGQVREDRLEETKNRVPALVSVSLTEAQADLVTQLAIPYIVPNSFYNEALTTANRQAASEAVTPIEQTFVEGQIVIGRGRIVTEADLEALNALGLIAPERGWENIVSHALSVVIAIAVIGLYMARFNPIFFHSPRTMLYASILFLAFLLAARFTVPDRTVLPFLLPWAGLSMLIAITLGPNVAITMTIILAALVGVLANSRLEVAVYVAVGGIVSALALGKAERVNAFFWGGLAASAANAGIVLVFWLADPDTDALGLAELLTASLINGALSASVTLIGLFLLGPLFDLTTPLQLIELGRPNHSLLQFMLRQAPGTYQHSLQVANLAEQAAERIGANTVLVRVGALFHDIGKSLHPEYFVENQIEGENPHDGFLPEVSAQCIIQHVPDGLKMAAKHRLPRAIRDCIAEHHGTNIARYQYQRAVQMAEGDESKVDKSKFTYPGPKPQTKETALLMLADGCEAKSRSDLPRNAEEIEKIVKTILDSRFAAGQLNECGLTMQELEQARLSFIETLQGFFHSRLKYPEEKVDRLEEEVERHR